MILFAKIDVFSGAFLSLSAGFFILSSAIILFLLQPYEAIFRWVSEFQNYFEHYCEYDRRSIKLFSLEYEFIFLKRSLAGIQHYVFAYIILSL